MFRARNHRGMAVLMTIYKYSTFIALSLSINTVSYSSPLPLALFLSLSFLYFNPYLKPLKSCDFLLSSNRAAVESVSIPWAQNGVFRSGQNIFINDYLIILPLLFCSAETERKEMNRWNNFILIVKSILINICFGRGLFQNLCCN